MIIAGTGANRQRNRAGLRRAYASPKMPHVDRPDLLYRMDPRVNLLIEGLRAVCGRAPLTEKWLVCPSRRVGQQWLDQVALAAAAVGNVRLHTLRSLAIALAHGNLSRQKLHFFPDDAGPMLVAQLWPQVAGRREGYLGALQPDERLYSALFRSIRDLRLAGTSELSDRAFDEPRKATELQELLEAYGGRLNALGRVDYPGLIELALETVLGGQTGFPQDLCLLLPDDLCESLTGRERVLVDSIAEALGNDRFVKLGADRSPFADDDESTTTVRDEATALGRTQFFRAIGPVNEVREAVRRSIAAAGRLDRIELLHTDAATYVPLVYETAARLADDDSAWNMGMPVTFADGIDVSMTRPGRALTAWLEWMENDFAQSIVHRMLVDGLIAVDDIDRIEGRFATLGRCLRSIPIVRSLDRYTMIRDLRDGLRKRLADQPGLDDEDRTAAKRMRDDQRHLAECEHLWQVVEPICELSRAAQEGPVALVDAAGALLARFSRSCTEFDALARQHLAERIDRLRETIDQWPDGSVAAVSDVRQWLEAIVRDSRVGGSGPQPGHLHVAHVDRGGHSGRLVTAIVGLDDGRFPGAAHQDPVLLDTERHRLNKTGRSALAASFDAPARRRASFARLLGRLRGDVFLGFSNHDVIEQRELFPSPLIIEAFRTVVDDRDADVQQLIKACGPAASFVPAHSGDSIDLNEWWVTLLTSERRVDDVESLLATHFPNLHRGRSAAAKRASTAFTEFDGRVDGVDPRLAPTHQDGPIVSASRLETFGTCPLRYFFRYILDIEPPDNIEIDPDCWLDPLAFGKLLHEVFHRFMDELAKANEQPQFDRDIGRLYAVLDEAIDRYRQRTPPPNEQSYLTQQRRLKESVEVFLAAEQDRCRTWRPRYLEASIGMRPASPGTAIDRDDPIALTLADGKTIRLRARVDRIDQRLGTSRFEICDYKTGRSTAKFTQADPFAGGRSLQHFLYLHVIAAVLRQFHGHGAVTDAFHYFFPNSDQHGRRIRFEADDLTDGLKRIAAMSEQIANGAFLPTESHQDCAYCDYEPICSATHTSLAEAAKQNRLKRQETDQTLLAPMQIWRPLKPPSTQPKVREAKPIQAAKTPADAIGDDDRRSAGAAAPTWPGESTAAPTGPDGAPPDQAERDQIHNDLDTNMLVEAAAGTGKTTMMIDRMLQLVRTGRCTVARMAAVTFTRKAASELRDRFHRALRRAASEEADPSQRRHLQEARDALDRCFIGTIHSFCAALLRERPVEAGVDIGFEELDEAEDMRLKRQSWREHVERLRADTDPLLDALDQVGLDPPDLMQAYIELCDYPDVDRWPLRCDGRPDDEPVVIDQDQVDRAWAAVRRFVNELRDTAADFPRVGGTLMQAIQRVVRMIDAANRGIDPSLQRRMAVFEQFSEFDPDKSPHMTKTKWPGENRKERSELAERVCEHWNRLCVEHAVPLVEMWHQVRYAPAMNLLLGAADAYASARATAGVLNYQDLLLKTRDMLRRHGVVRRDFARRTTHLLVDEFQDTDPIQAEILFHLAAIPAKASDTETVHWSQSRPRPGSLFVVGDPKQSIYRFRRADIETYDLVRRLIERSGGRRIDLRANFRSSAAIVDWVNEVFRDLLPARGDRYSPAYQQFGVGRTDGNNAQLRGVCALDIEGSGTVSSKTAQGEAEIIARIIRTAVDQGVTVCRTAQELAEGRSPRAEFGDFLVISRGKARLGLYARALERYGIPHEVTGGSALNSVPQLALLHTCLRAVLHADDPTALVAALRSDLFGISDTALYAFSRAGGRFSYRSSAPQRMAADHHSAAASFDDAFMRLRRYERWLDRLPPIAAIDKIAVDLGLQPCAAMDEGGDVRAGSIARAIELLRAAGRQLWTAADLVDYLGTLIDTEAEDAELHDGMPVRTQDRPVVRVMNLHKAKGLEAPVVFLADPCGEKEHRITIHVSRHESESGSGGQDHATGFMAICGPFSLFRQRGALLARPPGWETLEEVEKKFAQAEARRLLYVAATRAGSQLVVSRRIDPSGRQRSPWQALEPYLDYLPVMPIPVPGEPPIRESFSVADSEPRHILDTINAARSAAASPSYSTAMAKRLGMDTAAATSHAPAVARDLQTLDTDDAPAIDAEQTLTAPAQWGQTIHMLLQIAAQDPQVDLELEALELLRQFDGHDRDAPEAAAVVRRVMLSDVWQRAQGSSSRFTEVPFCLRDDLEGCPRLIRGAIDLVFREAGRWVIVDYKTDRIDGPPPEKLLRAYRGQLDVYRRAWSALSSADEAEIDAAIYFTRPNLLVS